MKYTITRALAELKVLKSRFTKELSNLSPIAVKQGVKLRKPFSSYQEKDFIENAKSDYQSIISLEKRIIEIKNKIDDSNFKTKVVICGKEMTVQEVINAKNLISFKEDLLDYLKAKHRVALSDFELAQVENRNRVEKIVQDQTVSGTSRDSSELEKKTLESIDNLYKVELVDPLVLDKEIKDLEKELEDFKNNVDYVLSESNSTTYIEIED